MRLPSMRMGRRSQMVSGEVVHRAIMGKYDKNKNVFAMQTRMGAKMTTQGSITRLELITWATKQMDQIDEVRQNIDESMNTDTGLNELEHLYAKSRELSGAQRVLRSLLVKFDANTVLPRQDSEGSVNMSSGPSRPMTEEEYNRAANRKEG